MHLDPRHIDFVRTIIADIRRGVTDAVVVARGVEFLGVLIEGDERPAERYRRENAQALREMAALGDSRDSAMQVARRWSSDPNTRQTLAQRFRGLRRTRK
jgi:hypothetical protein